VDVWGERWGRGTLPVSAWDDADTHHLETEQGLLVEGLPVHDDLASAAGSWEGGPPFLPLGMSRLGRVLEDIRNCRREKD
jgi:hypothetical protein